MCDAALPDGIDKDMSVILLVVNIFFPGVGTLVAACLGTTVSGATIAVGIAQLLLAILIVGWVWAIVWSVALYKKASDKAYPTGHQVQEPQQHVASPPSAVQQPYAQYPPQSPPPQSPPPQPPQSYGHAPNMPPKFVESTPPSAPPPSAPQ